MARFRQRFALSCAGCGLLIAVGLVAWALATGSSEAQQDGIHNCPQAGKWAISVWDGPDGTETGEALATCEAVDVGAEERDLGEGKGEGANLLGAQAVFESVEVAPSAGSGQALGGAGAGSFAAPSMRLRAGRGGGRGKRRPLQVNGSGSWEPPFEEFRAGARAGQAPPWLRVYDRITVRVVEQGYVTGRGAFG